MITLIVWIIVFVVSVFILIKAADFFTDSAEKIGIHFDRLSELNYNYAGSSLSPDYEVKYDKSSKEFVLELKNELGIYDIRYTLL